MSYLMPHVLAEILTAAVFGGMLFFAGVVAPMVFSQLPQDMAARFIRSMFPVYYLTMALAAGLGALLAALGRPLDGALLLAVSAGFLIARQGLMPRINRLRDAELAGDAQAGAAFGRWHRYSVWLNAAQLVIVTVVLFRLAATGVPA